jgi:UDP-N-acetylglucosamine transferase subunit ALG13
MKAHVSVVAAAPVKHQSIIDHHHHVLSAKEKTFDEAIEAHQHAVKAKLAVLGKIWAKATPT